MIICSKQKGECVRQVLFVLMFEKGGNAQHVLSMLTALFTATVSKDGALIQLILGLPTKRLKVDIDVSIILL